MNPANKFFIFPIEVASTVGMADSTRYNIITEATFSNYFGLSPSNDLCNIVSYAIYVTITPLVPWPISDTRVILYGSIGFY